jgi:hypothetical protein
VTSPRRPVPWTRRKLSRRAQEPFCRSLLATSVRRIRAPSSPVHAVCTACVSCASRSLVAQAVRPDCETQTQNALNLHPARTADDPTSRPRGAPDAAVRPLAGGRRPRNGLYCYKQLDIEAYPNPVPPMIEIITQPNGWSGEEVERYVTVPLENALNGSEAQRILNAKRAESTDPGLPTG